MPRGGARIGAGRKPKTMVARWLAGDAGKRGQRVESAMVSAVLERVDLEPSPMLTEAEAAYWELWAPLALSAGTLTAATRPGLVLLCQVACRAARVWADVERDGTTHISLVTNPDGTTHEVLKAHPQMTQYRGLIGRQEMLLARYGLAGSGKVVRAAQPAAVDPFQAAQARGSRLRAVK